MKRKPFHTLTHEEAKRLANECVRGAHSEDEIRRRLIEAGFEGETIRISSSGTGEMFTPAVSVRDHNHEFIFV